MRKFVKPKTMSKHKKAISFVQKNQLELKTGLKFLTLTQVASLISMMTKEEVTYNELLFTKEYKIKKG